MDKKMELSKKLEYDNYINHLVEDLVQDTVGVIYRSKISYEDLAYKSGLHKSTIKKIMDGKTKCPRISTLVKLCDVMNINLNVWLNHNS